jgi:hypothetical protein
VKDNTGPPTVYKHREEKLKAQKPTFKRTLNIAQHSLTSEYSKLTQHYIINYNPGFLCFRDNTL